MFLVFFFFSSRRRHTRLVSDWSSDVCSSDLFGYWHSFNLLACGGGGGGFSTVTELVVEAVRPRESVQVALIVMGPAEAPVVFSVAAVPLPEMLPPLAGHPPTVTGTLSGLVQARLIVDEAPV